jgi:diguanylate cyclase (GGDEF)-like protein
MVRPPILLTRTRPGRATVSLATFLLFAALTPLIYGRYGASGGALLMIPDMVVGALCGPWLGSLAAVLNFTWYGLIIHLAGGDALGSAWAGGPGPYLMLLSGAAAGWLVQMRAETSANMEERERRLQFLEEHDPLTGIWTRSRFHAELADRLRSGAAGSVLFIDLDGFQYVNESLGHQVGDDLLRHIAEQLQALYGREGFVARVGGDEFAVCLPETNGEAACQRAEELPVALRYCPLMVGDQAVSVGASAGVALFPEHGRDPIVLLRKAYAAVYRAKEDGRNQAQLYRPSEAPSVSFADKVRWEELIRDSLEYDRFVLHGQPVLDLATSKITHHELLLRMVLPDGSLVPPGAFIGVAEGFGLIRWIDRWVVIASVRMAARLPEHHFALNLSAKALGDPELIPLIRAEIAASGVDPSRLTFEVTETAAISNMDRAVRFVTAVRELGCDVALDDFGAGFSSFSSLRSLPLTHLKIDGSLIRGLSQDPISQQLVTAICDMAQALGMKTVAEFVEDEETVRCLRTCGADYAQGYHIGKPEPLEDEKRSRAM